MNILISDTDYEDEHLKWWQIIIGIFVIIVLVFGIYSTFRYLIVKCCAYEEGVRQPLIRNSSLTVSRNTTKRTSDYHRDFSMPTSSYSCLQVHAVHTSRKSSLDLNSIYRVWLADMNYAILENIGLDGRVSLGYIVFYNVKLIII